MKLSILKSSVAFILFVVLTIQMAKGQALGSWRPYMAYQKATMVAVASDGYVYAIYDGSLMKYKPASGNSLSETKLLSKVDGLNDVTIVQIAYVEAEGILVIVYDSGNIDLYDTKSGDVYNLADIKDKTSVADKTVNGINIYDSFAYISMNFGIIAVDVKNKVIKSTYNINKKTYSMCFWQEHVYAATEKGIVRADKKANLLTEANWSLYSSVVSKKILTWNNCFFFYQEGSGISYQVEPGGTPISFSVNPMNAPTNLNQMTLIKNQLVLVNNSAIYFYLNSTSAPEKKTVSNVACISSIDGSTYWMALNAVGICSIDKNSGNMSNPVTINSPKRNLIGNMNFSQGKLIVVGGGMNANNYDNPGTFMIMEKSGSENIWLNVNETDVQSAIIAQTGISYICRDFSDAIVDPKDKNHYFVTSFGQGLYEFRSNIETKKIEFIKLYEAKNTNKIFVSVVDNPNYIRLGSLTYDSKGNLYIISSKELAVENAVIIYSSEGKWMSLYDQNLPKVKLFKDLIITNNDQKWAVSPRPGTYSGLYVFKDSEVGNSQSIISYFSSSFSDQDGEKLDITLFNCVVEDLNGTIWVGTNMGPILFYNPTEITKSAGFEFNRCSRAKIPKNDGTDLADYLLNGVSISTIAVDGANRKWIGTNGAGVFLVSPTGDEVLANYTAENSPLLSNTINKIVINNDNGEVFIGTNKGLISYTALATEGKSDYSNVYAYPNPVKPDFIGDVVITGLIKDSNVKITDLSGNVMSQGTSVGGQFSWNCKNRSGERVKTGVYLVMAATSDGTQGVVSKIVVIK